MDKCEHEIREYDEQDGWRCIKCKISANQIERLEIATLRQEIERLKGALREAAADISDWGSYADEYFQKKHDLKGCVEQYLRLAEPPNEQ